MEPQSKRGAIKRVLVVDDAMDMRIYLKSLVQSLGLEPVAARDGTEALRKLREEPFHLVILDLMMPGEGGILMYRTLKETPCLKEVPVIIHSAISEALFAHYLHMEMGCGRKMEGPLAYLEKPVEPSRLKEAIKRNVR